VLVVQPSLQPPGGEQDAAGDESADTHREARAMRGEHAPGRMGARDRAPRRQADAEQARTAQRRAGHVDPRFPLAC